MEVGFAHPEEPQTRVAAAVIPAPTIAELQAYVASGELRYVIVGGGGQAGGTTATSTSATSSGSDATAATRNAWVTSACTLVDDGGTGTSMPYDGAGAVTTGG